jgi:hypothetical protein
VSHEKLFERSTISVPDLPQHPPARLVHQIFAIVDETFAESESVRKVAVPDEMEGRKHRNATIP